MTGTGPTVFVIDDASVRSAERLVPFLGFGVRTFASAKEFLDVRRGVDVRKVYHQGPLSDYPLLLT